MISSKEVRVGITHGDPNGIGYEIILKTLKDHRMLEICTPIIYGNSSALKQHQKAAHLDNLTFKKISEPSQAKHNSPNLIEVGDKDYNVEFGLGTEASGKLAYDSLERAVKDLQEGEIDVLVTAPINKDNIQSDEFKFPGHTEYLASKDEKEDSLMFMVSDLVKVAVATGHMPVSEISNQLNKDLILDKIKLMEKSLKLDFSVRKPKIAVLGLNPHAGDNGLLGKEDQDIVVPAIEEARRIEKLVYGPFAADGFFGSGGYRNYDGVVAMYHDQGLIPFKTIAFGMGTNFTAGLSFIRTSPDHGTGFDIAGKNLADASSLRQAIYSGIDIFKNRSLNEELGSNVLQNLSKSRKGDRY